jgi:hypothetical protein
MEANGMALALLDIPRWCTEEYNRWYDLDHLPEHISKGDVLLGRRYVATREMRDLPGIQPSAWIGGYPPYMTNYWFGGPLDFMSEEARSLWQVKDRGIVKAGRYWQVGRGVHNSRWRVADAFTRPSSFVDKAAVPYLAHRGMIVAAGRPGSGHTFDEAVAWWDSVHLPDLFSVPGLLAAVRLVPATPENDGMIAHMLLCEDDPGEVVAAIHRSATYWGAVGRYPAHRGVYEPIAFLPYRWIVPLDYDFDIGEPYEMAGDAGDSGAD